MKLTPWFPPDVKPVRVGVYEKSFLDGHVWYSKWDGKQWLRASNDRCLAAISRDPSIYTRTAWRGIRGPA